MRSLRLIVLAMFLSITARALGRDVEGILTDERGHPRPWEYLATDMDHIDFKVQADEDGKFVIKDPPTTQRHWMTTWTPAGKCGLFVIEPDATRVEVKLSRTCMNVDGRVVDAQGRGVSKAAVDLYCRQGDEEFFITRATTDSGGYFDDYVPGGEGLQLIARVKSADNVLASSRQIDLKDDQFCLEMPDIQLPADAKVETGADTRRRVGGVVRDEKGAPIAGVKVRIEWEPERRNVYSALAVTGTDGRWSRRFNRNAKELKLQLTAERHVSTIFDRWASSPPMEKLIDQSAVSVLPRGHLLRGVVRDESGKPVDDALVLAACSGAGGGQPSEDIATRTNADGTFELDGLPPDKLEIVIYGRDLAPAVIERVISKTTTPVEITLKQGSELRGIVVDVQDKPIAGAELSIYTWKRPTGQWNWLPRNPKTDSEGRFIFAHLPPGSFVIQVWKKGFNSSSHDDVIVQPEPARFVLGRPATLAGRVVEDATGEPVKSFTLVTGWRDEKVGFIYHGDGDDMKIDAADGKFSERLRWRGATTQPLRVIADDFLVKDTFVDTRDGAGPAEIRLTRGEALAGTVTDRASKPVADAQVAWVGPGLQAFIDKGKLQGDYVYRAELETRTDTTGRFKLPRIVQKGHIVITCEDGYAIVAGDALSKDSAITLTPYARVEGVVHAGRADGKTYVGLMPPDKSYFDDRSPVRWMLGAVTEPDGSFRFTHVPAIPMRVARNELGLISHAQSIEPKPGETLKIDLGGGGVMVAGTLHAPASFSTDSFNTKLDVGKRHTQIYARLADAPKPTGSDSDVGCIAALKPDGHFEITGLPPGKYELVAAVHAPRMPQSCGMPIAIASGAKEFEVASGKSMDLGVVDIQPHNIAAPGQPAPALAGMTLDGKSASIEALKGKFVVLDFWASWCAPCKAATPRVRKLYETHGAHELAVLGINLDYKAEDGQGYATAEKLPWPSIAITGWGDANPVLRAYGITSIPSFWLIDRDGKVLARDIPPEELEAVVTQHLR